MLFFHAVEERLQVFPCWQQNRNQLRVATSCFDMSKPRQREVLFNFKIYVAICVRIG